MEIKPPSLIPKIDQSRADADDLWRRPQNKVYKLFQSSQAFSFENQKLYFDKKEIGRLITEMAHLPAHKLGELAQKVKNFKDQCEKRRKNRLWRLLKLGNKIAVGDLDQVIALCDAHLSQISELLQRQLGQTQDGLNIHFDADGQLILNGVNVDAFIDQCQATSQERALTYLKGLRERLFVAYENRSNRRQLERLKEVFWQRIARIDQILQRGP